LASASSCALTGLDAGVTYSVSVAGQLNNWISAAATTTLTTIVVAAVPALVVSPSSSTQTAGAAFNVTITATVNGVTDVTYSGNKTLDWSGGLTSPGNFAPSYPTNPVNFVAGMATVPVTLFKASSTAQTLLVTDHNAAGYTGSTSPGITVNSAGVQLSFSPGSTQVTKNTTNTFTVLVPNDAYGNAYVSATGLSVSLSLTNTSNWGFGSTGTGTKSLTITSGPAGNTFSITESGANKAATLSGTITATGFTAPVSASLTSSN